MPAEEPAHEIDIPAAALLARLDPLPYPRRMRALALHARRLAGTPRLRVLLGELAEQGEYGRRTALHVAMAGRDLDHIADVLAGTDMRLRRAALRAVRTLPVPDAAVAGAFRDAPAGLRSALYRTLRGRPALADALLPGVRERWGDREAAALLPACGSATVARSLPELAHAVTSWKALAKRHPGAVLDAAEAELAAGVHPRVWWRRRGAGVELAAGAAPGRMLALLERHDLRRIVPRLPAAVLNALFRTDAVRAGKELAGAFSTDWAEPPGAVLRHLRAAPDADILPFAAEHRLGAVLRALPPARRAAIFEAVAGRRGGSTGLWSMRVLRWLPGDLAAAEARRMLAWHDSVWHSARSRLDDPGIPLELTSYLPYEEAVGPLREAAVGGDPRRRGPARKLLVQCTARTGDAGKFGALLAALALRAANERDPLRRDLLGALGEVPPGLFGDACAGTLERLATDAAEAPDCSPATREALSRLAGRVLSHHDPASAPELVAWALGAFGKLVARYGADGLLPAHRLDLRLRAGQEHDLLAVVRPHLRAARERADFTPAVALARALGRRARALPELQADLRVAVREAPEPLAREAAGLWLARTAEREARVVELVREDPSAVALPAVWRTVARRRTDLLLPLLDADAAGPGWVPPIGGGEAGRWTPAQRARVRARLAGTAGDERLPIEARAAAVRAVGRVGGGLGLLTAWADGEETVRAEAAVAAMAGGGEPALPALLAAASGRASRVAVAALAACCREVPPSRLGPCLETALTGADAKVTLRKLAARQLGRNRPPGAVDALLRAWAHPGLHRDVRVSVASVLRTMPGDPRVMDALSGASGEPLLRALFQAHPLEYAPAVRPRYADLVRRLFMAADLPGVRFRGGKAFGEWAPWYRGDHGEIVGAVADPEASGQATEVFLALLRAGTIRSETLGVLARLAAASGEEPAGERVAAIVEVLAGMRGDAEPWRRRLARDAMDVLAGHPLLLPQVVRLATALLPEDADGLGDALCALADLLGDRPVLAYRTASRAIPALFGAYEERRSLPPGVVLPVARRLADRGDLAAGWFAVNLIRIGGERTDWPDPWRELLRRLRDSPHLEIRQEARDTPIG